MANVRLLLSFSSLFRRHRPQPTEPRRQDNSAALRNDESRGACATRLVQNLVQDLRYALRSYRRNPGFVAVVAVTLMLGIGVNAALFTAFDTFVLSPPPSRDPAQLVTIGLREKGERGEPRDTLLSYASYQSLRDRDPVFAGLAAYTEVDAVSPSGALFGMAVSDNYFAVLGGQMILGRPFAEEENEVPGANPLVVLSFKAWQRRFQGDHDIIGKSIRLAGRSFTVIGVTEPKFGGLDVTIPEFWTPIMMRAALGRGGPVEETRVAVVGRLPQGVSIERARAAVFALTVHLLPERPIIGVTLASQKALGRLDKSTMRMYLPFAVVFGAVLLIACANVANLMLSRAVSRRREISVRLSLGASRARLVQQLLTESSLLALAGGLLALPFSQLVIRTISNAIIAMFPAWLNFDFVGFRLDASVFLYTMLVSLLASIFFGLVPALQSTRRDLASALKDDSQGAASRLRGLGPRNRLVVIQLALCLVLLITTARLLGPVVQARNLNPGFNMSNVFGVTIMRSLHDGDPDKVVPLAQLRMSFAERLRRLPAVKNVSLARQNPLNPMPQMTVALEAQTRIRDAGYAYVTPAYFETLQIPILRGRQFTESEIATEAPLAIISEAAASAFWPGQDPLGKTIRLQEQPRPRGAGATWRGPQAGSVEVIGVARNVGRGVVWDSGDSSCLYLPTRTDHPTNTSMLVRIDGATDSAIAAIRAEFAALDRDAILDIHALSDGTGGLPIAQRFAPKLAGFLGIVGMLLATVGLYGVISWAVAQRTHEIGVRMALGAQRLTVLWLILRQGLRLALGGLLIGVPLAAALNRVLARGLLGMKAFDPIAFTLVPAFLLIVCLVAVFVPARRATRLDPLVALRHE